MIPDLIRFQARYLRCAQLGREACWWRRGRILPNTAGSAGSGRLLRGFSKKTELLVTRILAVEQISAAARIFCGWKRAKPHKPHSHTFDTRNQHFMIEILTYSHDSRAWLWLAHAGILAGPRARRRRSRQTVERGLLLFSRFRIMAFLHFFRNQKSAQLAVTIFGQRRLFCWFRGRPRNVQKKLLN